LVDLDEILYRSDAVEDDLDAIFFNPEGDIDHSKMMNV
jgi:hypothetical protein